MEMNEKTKKLFKGISKEKIDELEKEYRNMCLKRLQNIEDECITMLYHFLSENSVYGENEDDDNVMFDLFNIQTEFNDKSLFGIKDEITMYELINNNN
mgnify:CR=1 FL=1